jgi:hypothetical protein
MVTFDLPLSSHSALTELQTPFEVLQTLRRDALLLEAFVLRSEALVILRVDFPMLKERAECTVALLGNLEPFLDGEGGDAVSSFAMSARKSVSSSCSIESRR